MLDFLVPTLTVQGSFCLMQFKSLIADMYFFWCVCVFSSVLVDAMVHWAAGVGAAISIKVSSSIESWAESSASWCVLL